MHEKTTDSTGSRIEIFIIAPSGEINVPVMELHINVPNCMGKVPTDEYALGMRVGCDGFDVKVLTGVVLDAGKHDQSSGGGVSVDRVKNFRRGRSETARRGCDKNHSRTGIEAVMPDLGFHCVLSSNTLDLVGEGRYRGRPT